MPSRYSVIACNRSFAFSYVYSASVPGLVVHSLVLSSLWQFFYLATALSEDYSSHLGLRSRACSHLLGCFWFPFGNLGYNSSWFVVNDMFGLVIWLSIHSLQMVVVTGECSIIVFCSAFLYMVYLVWNPFFACISSVKSVCNVSPLYIFHVFVWLL